MTHTRSSEATPAPHPDALGVIISLPEELSAELAQRREEFGGPVTAATPPHITLISGCATASWEQAGEHVREVARTMAPFEVALRGTGTFAPISSVVFLNLVKGVEDCLDLHQQLLEGPVDHLLDFEFHPHLTMAHDLDEVAMTRATTELADFSASFQVSSIGLYDYAEGRWSLREELHLGGDTQS